MSENTEEHCAEKRSTVIFEKESKSRMARRLKRRIYKFETIIEQLNEAIHKLGNSEISAEELEDEQSNFVRLETLQLKVLKARQTLHALCRRLRRLDGSLSEGETSTLDDYKVKRPIEHGVQFVGSGYDQIDCALTRFVNRQRAKHFDPKTSLNFLKSSYNFPSCAEVLSIVNKENERNALQMTKEEMEALAQRLCNDVIALLKRRTVAERKQTVQDMLTESDDIIDPATNDEALNKKLSENRRLALINQKALEQLPFETDRITLPELVKREGLTLETERTYSTMLSCYAINDGSVKHAPEDSNSVGTSSAFIREEKDTHSTEIHCSDESVDFTEAAETDRVIEVIDLLDDSPEIEIITPDDIE